MIQIGTMFVLVRLHMRTLPLANDVDLLQLPLHGTSTSAKMLESVL
jgi:hypothetical protein